MFGQTDELQEIVDKYVEENHLYEYYVPPRINVRKYLQYVEENNITDPSTIPSEVLMEYRIESPRS